MPGLHLVADRQIGTISTLLEREAGCCWRHRQASENPEPRCALWTLPEPTARPRCVPGGSCSTGRWVVRLTLSDDGIVSETINNGPHPSFLFCFSVSTTISCNPFIKAGLPTCDLCRGLLVRVRESDGQAKPDFVPCPLRSLSVKPRVFPGFLSSFLCGGLYTPDHGTALSSRIKSICWDCFSTELALWLKSGPLFCLRG